MGSSCEILFCSKLRYHLLINAKAELALKESKLPYTRFEIDLKNKPEWYAPQVNPVSKVRICYVYRTCYILMAIR